LASSAPIANRRKLGRLTIGPQVANVVNPPHNRANSATLK
jgi:hypothetical protein